MPTASTPVVNSPIVVEVKPEPVAITVGTSELKTADLKAAFENQISEDTLSPDAFLEQAINDQRILADAQKRGYDKTDSFKEEVEGYRSMLAESYLTDSTTIKQLLERNLLMVKRRSTCGSYHVSTFRICRAV